MSYAVDVPRSATPHRSVSYFGGAGDRAERYGATETVDLGSPEFASVGRASVAAFDTAAYGDGGGVASPPQVVASVASAGLRMAAASMAPTVMAGSMAPAPSSQRGSTASPSVSVVFTALHTSTAASSVPAGC
jgi:hypothetical protein